MFKNICTHYKNFSFRFDYPTLRTRKNKTSFCMNDQTRSYSTFLTRINRVSGQFIIIIYNNIFLTRFFYIFFKYSKMYTTLSFYLNVVFTWLGFGSSRQLLVMLLTPNDLYGLCPTDGRIRYSHVRLLLPRGTVNAVPDSCSAYRPQGHCCGLFWSGRAPGQRGSSDSNSEPKPLRYCRPDVSI